MTLIATQVKRRRGTTAENDAFTGAEGEITVDTEKHQLRVHDGTTQGGFVIGSGGSGRNVGDMFMTKRTDTALAGAVECDGGTYNTEDYEGDGSIGELLEAGKLDYISLTAYATAISTKGWCDKIGWNGTGTTSFRVPTLTPHIVQKNNIPVIGNGKSICYTNGSTTDIAILSKTGTTSPATDVQTGEYTGTLGNITGTAWYNGELGITTDGTKSGIITDLSDVATTERVMIQLFNSTTDEAVATVGTVVAQVGTNTSDITSLKNMSNVTATGKETVVGWGIPDYSAGISVPFTTTWNTTGQTYTAPASGEFRLSNLAGHNPDTLSLFVNDIELCRSGKGSTVPDWRTFSCSVSKGDIIKVCTESGSFTATGVICKFFPYKGVI